MRETWRPKIVPTTEATLCPGEDVIRVLCISDTHNKHSQLDQLIAQVQTPHILIHAGDFSNHGTPKETEAFLPWFAGLHPDTVKHRILCGGNHDFLHLPAKSKEFISQQPISYVDSGWVQLTDLPESFTVYVESFGYPSDFLSANPTILVTHEPPLGILDIAPPNRHIGSSQVLELSKTLKPSLHVFGHVHMSYGIHETQKTLYVNAASFNGKIQPPIVIDFTLQ